MGQSDSPRDDLQTCLLDIARAREGNAAALRRVSQQLLEVRVLIRKDLELPCPEGQSSAAERQERGQRLVERIVQDVTAQEELGSQFEAGLAITARLRSVLRDVSNQGFDVSEVLSRLDQVLRHDA